MLKRLTTMLACVLLLVGVLVLPGCSSGTAHAAANAGASQSARSSKGSQNSQSSKAAESAAEASTKAKIKESGTYVSKEEVALYLHTYGHLPGNYVTKDEAEDAGWKTEGLSLEEACPGKSIGGDRFGNREGRLPKAKGRTWYECDIDYKGGRRGAKRIVYSNDGLIYYTQDHYKTFEKLY